jgi:20S proteasome alpha/beta subunit
VYNQYLDVDFVQEALELGKRAIYHATHRDAYSGGVINGTWTFLPPQFLLFSKASH